MVERKTVKVRFNEPGVHRWSGAPESRAYLANDHRHLFYFEISVQVAGDDREIEFHDLLDLSKAIVMKDFDFKNGLLIFGEKSCEMIAKNIIDKLQKELRMETGELSVCVTEDNENGAQITRVLDVNKQVRYGG